MTFLRILASPLLAALALCGPLAAQVSPPTDSSAVAAELRPGDVVKLQVWREPDLSGEFVVDERSSVVIPKLGPISVSGRTPAALKDSLQAGFATYLRNPSVDVTFLRRITILGAVETPGLYTVDPTVTLAGALALAGGVANDGKKDRVELVRGDERKMIDLDQPTALTDAQLRSGDQLIVPQRSWLSRNPWIFAAVITSGAGLLRVALD